MMKRFDLNDDAFRDVGNFIVILYIFLYTEYRQ